MARYLISVADRLKPGFHYPNWRPELTARVGGWPVSITRQYGPCWRARVSTSRVDGPSTRHFKKELQNFLALRWEEKPLPEPTGINPRFFLTTRALTSSRWRRHRDAKHVDTKTRRKHVAVVSSHSQQIISSYTTENRLKVWHLNSLQCKSLTKTTFSKRSINRTTYYYCAPHWLIRYKKLPWDNDQQLA